MKGNMSEQNEMTGSILRALKRADRFDNYREIRAGFAGHGVCGHPVAKGDVVGWSKRHGVRCTQCWTAWVAENRAADEDERFMASQGGGY